MSDIIIRAAQTDDIGTIQAFILALADYERLAHEVKADRETLARYLFGERPMAEVLIAEAEGAAVGFALFFHNFSTFEGRPGLYLEDLFVLPEARGLGAGKALLSRLAALAIERDCAPGMVGAGLERAVHRLLPRAGRPADGRVDGAAGRRAGAGPAGGALRRVFRLRTACG
jgi:GNAT superfamily N-acetyltransferase